MARAQPSRVRTWERLGFLLLVVAQAAAGCGGSRQLDPGGGAEAGGAGANAAGNALFVALGPAGRILTSVDGMIWMARSTGVDRYVTSIAAGPSGFVAVGGAGVIMSSRNGISWKLAASPTATDLNHVIFAGDRFIAVGQSWTTGSAALTSLDGDTWVALPSPSNYMFHGVAAVGGDLVAAAYFRSDLQTPALFHSSNGGAWTQRAGPDFRASLSTPGLLVTAGGGWGVVSFSTDGGVAWESQMLSDDIVGTNDLAWNGSMFVTVGGRGLIFSSSDARAWTKRESPLGTGISLSAVCHGAGLFVAVGGSGQIATSADGAEWTGRTSGVTDSLLDVAYGPMI